MKRSIVIFILRIVGLSALGFMFWVKLRAPRDLQLAIVGGLFLLVLLILNDRCARVIVEFLTIPKLQDVRLIARWTGIYVFVIGVAAIVACDIEVGLSLGELAKSKSLSSNSLGAVWLPGITGLILTWAGAYELRIIGASMDYFSLGSGRRSLLLEEIDRARLRFGWFTYADRFRPTSRLEVLPKESLHLKPIIVNTKAFKARELDVLFDWLGDKLEQG